VRATNARAASNRLLRHAAESHEHRKIDHDVRDGVEVATGERHLVSRAGERAVDVVEQRLQLEEQRGGEEITARKDDRGDQPDRRVREDDGGRRNSRPNEQRHEQVRERSEDELENELATGSSRLDGCGRDRHRTRS
jgi:hypothetical protein